jgi:hypothetical protein
LTNTRRVKFSLIHYLNDTKVENQEKAQKKRLRDQMENFHVKRKKLGLKTLTSILATVNAVSNA